MPLNTSARARSHPEKRRLKSPLLESGEVTLILRNAHPTGRRYVPGHGPLGPGETCTVPVDLALRLVGEGLVLAPSA